jgi:hypothetical protein
VNTTGWGLGCFFILYFYLVDCIKKVRITRSVGPPDNLTFQVL